MPLPIGLVYDPAQRVVLDPDQQVQQTLRHFFDTFRRCGSAWFAVVTFRQEGLKFPRHGQGGSGELSWEHCGTPVPCAPCAIRSTRGHSASAVFLLNVIQRCFSAILFGQPHKCLLAASRILPCNIIITPFRSIFVFLTVADGVDGRLASPGLGAYLYIRQSTITHGFG